MVKVLSSILIAFCLFVFQLAPSKAQTIDGPIYIVQEGDTLNTIAVRFNVTSDELIQANPAVDPDWISIGEQLVIPGLDGVEGVLTSRIIPFGENLESLTHKFRVQRDTLIQLNHITSPAEVYAGTNLIVPVTGEDIPSEVQSLFPVDLSIVEFAAIHQTNGWKVALLNNKAAPTLLPSGLVYTTGYSQTANKATSIHPSLLAVEVDQLPLTQGKTAIVELDINQPGEFSGKWNGKDLHFYPTSENQVAALQGIHAMLEPGLYPLSISGLFQDKSSFYFEQMVVVQKNYTFRGNKGDGPEILPVDPQGLDPELNDPENEYIHELTSPSTPEQYWNGVFFVPGYNREWITSRFGNRRIYNSDPKTYFHTGVDFEGGTGLPVKAAATGKVVHADLLTVRGNTVVIDHGWGVYTAYLHMSEIQVQPGEIVEAGQVIGLVGATGLRLTGAHLHWEVWVNGVQVEPMDWLDNSYP